MYVNTVLLTHQRMIVIVYTNVAIEVHIYKTQHRASGVISDVGIAINTGGLIGEVSEKCRSNE